jgi:hypothetical protein
MSTNVTWNGITYAVPAAGETGWPALDTFLIALGNDAAITQEMKQAVRVATTTPVTVSDTTDCVIATKLAAAGAVAVNLPAGTNGRWFVVVDQTGDAGANNVTITPNGAETINGAATYVINQNRGAVVMVYSTTNTMWNVVARYTAGTALTNPMTTTGDVIYSSDGSGTPTRLAVGAAGTVLKGGATPSYAAILNADVDAGAAIAGSKLVAASAVVAGAVNTAAQSFGGLKKFENGLANTAYVGTDPEVGGASPFILTNAHNRIQIINPGGDGTIRLPTTSVIGGDIWVIHNRAAFDITVQSSGSNAIDIFNKGYIILEAAVNTPTSAANWLVREVYEETSHTTTITAINATPPSSAWKIVRNNKVVTLTLTASVTEASKVSTADPAFTTVLVARFRPLTTKRASILIKNNNVLETGYFTIGTSGSADWARANATTTWNSSAVVTLFELSATYDLT